jgi:hypothetical protein
VRTPILGLCVAWWIAAPTGLLMAQPATAVGAHVESRQEGAATRTDLDHLMAEVLKRRDASWRQLGNYVLDERERLEVVGPDRSVLYSLRREFTWYARDGVLVRSPTRVDGVQIGDDERRRYEDRWLREEKARAERRRARQAGRSAPAGGDEEGDPGRDPDEPRFISEAHFFRFRFSPGNYYFAGRETIEGRETLKVEYYPTSRTPDGRESRRASRPRDRDDEIERQLAKVSLVTLWVDPEVPQIVRFTFDNVDFDFLPGRWLVRLDDVRASMTMSQPFEDVWLPKVITMDGAATMATGTVQVRYVREFLDYRLAEVTTNWRVQ